MSPDEPLQRLSVLHLVLSIAREWGGLASKTADLARNQHRLGCRSTIWCLDSFRVEPSLERTLAAEIDELRVFPGSFPARLGRSAAMNRSVVDAGASHDVLH